MGRRIPVRKHMGVRDPLKQKHDREAKLNKVRESAPSANDADDPLPRRLQEINKVRQLIRDGKFNVKKNKRKKRKEKAPLSTAQFLGPDVPLGPGMKRPEKPIPILQQRPGEKDKTFVHRCGQICERLIQETKYEEKHNLNVVRNPETGLLESVTKKGKDEIEEFIKEERNKIKEASKSKRKKTKKQLEEEAERAAAKEEKLLKRKNRRKLKRAKLIQKALEKRQDKKGGSLVKHDSVQFGEVVDRPPEFSVRPRKSIAEKNVKDIMFNQMLINGKLKEKELKDKEAKAKTKPKGQVMNKTSLSGKRKDLPLGERRILEAQQETAVAAYRLLKARKEKSQ